MQDLMNDVNQFAADNRWIFWPIVGAIVTVMFGMRSIGFMQFKRGNHPIQAFIGLLVIGSFIGFFFAWITKAIFHPE